MRTDTFGGTLTFGFAAAVSLPATLALAHAVGLTGIGLALHLAMGSVLYCGGLGRGPRQRLGFALAAALALAIVAAAAASLRELALGAALVVAAGRLLARPPGSLRAWLLSVGGFVLALVFAGWLAGPGPIQASLAVWAFFLGLCPWPELVGEPLPATPDRDAFDEARTALARLLEDPP